MVVEVLVFGRDDRVAQVRRDVVVGNDEPPLGRELAERLAVRRVDARDRARRVVVEPGDERQVAGIREHHAAQDAQQRDGDEQRREPGVAGEANDVGLGGFAIEVPIVTGFRL